jgi:predicted transcriptional regulator
MKTLTAVAALALGLAGLGMAADFKGFVEDTACSGKPAMKGDAACAQKCIKGGSPAVLVMEDGTVYKIADQAKIAAHAGHNVTITGKLEGDTLSIDSVKMN